MRGERKNHQRIVGKKEIVADPVHCATGESPYDGFGAFCVQMMAGRGLFLSAVGTRLGGRGGGWRVDRLARAVWLFTLFLDG
jgi:hypothetical protein